MIYPFAIIGAVTTVFLCLAKNIWAFSPLLFIGFTAAYIALYFVILFIHSLFLTKTVSEQPSKYVRFIFNFTVGLIMKLALTKIEVEGADKIQKGQRYLVVGNHISNFDPMITALKLKSAELSYITKPSNLKIPIAGAFIRKICFLPINRENDREALKTVLQAIDLIKRDECSIGVYPEGTRNKTGEGLLEFHNGVFKIAQKANVPIVVVTTKGTNNIHKNVPFKPTKTKLTVCEILDCDFVKSHKTVEIGETVRNIMLNNLKEG